MPRRTGFPWVTSRRPMLLSTACFSLYVEFYAVNQRQKLPAFTGHSTLVSAGFFSFAVCECLLQPQHTSGRYWPGYSAGLLPLLAPSAVTGLPPLNPASISSPFHSSKVHPRRRFHRFVNYTVVCRNMKLSTFGPLRESQHSIDAAYSSRCHT